MPEPYYDEGGVTLYNADFTRTAATIGPESVDAVITDPPYNVGKKYGTHDDSLSPEEYRILLKGWLKLAGLISRDGVIYTPGLVNVLDTREVLDGTGLRPVRLLGWHKREYAGDKWTNGPAMCWEPVVWASKVDKPFYNKTFGWRGRDFLAVDSTHGDPCAKWHPCPKPLPVMRWLVGLFVPEGGTVLDPFAGSGATLLAAREAGVTSIGVEIEEEFCRRTVLERLGQGTLDFGAVA